MGSPNEVSLPLPSYKIPFSSTTYLLVFFIGVILRFPIFSISYIQWTWIARLRLSFC